MLCTFQVISTDQRFFTHARDYLHDATPLSNKFCKHGILKLTIAWPPALLIYTYSIVCSQSSFMDPAPACLCSPACVHVNWTVLRQRRYTTATEREQMSSSPNQTRYIPPTQHGMYCGQLSGSRKQPKLMSYMSAVKCLVSTSCPGQKCSDWDI